MFGSYQMRLRLHAAIKLMGQPMLGSIYRPMHIRSRSPTVLPRRYDAFLYLDRTEALRPLHLVPVEAKEVPETYPAGV